MFQLKIIIIDWLKSLSLNNLRKNKNEKNIIHIIDIWFVNSK
jgi:hypothetical protein